jgi:hypothetical protein
MRITIETDDQGAAAAPTSAHARSTDIGAAIVTFDGGPAPGGDAATGAAAVGDGTTAFNGGAFGGETAALHAEQATDGGAAG